MPIGLMPLSGISSFSGSGPNLSSIQVVGLPFEEKVHAKDAQTKSQFFIILHILPCLSNHSQPPIVPLFVALSPRYEFCTPSSGHLPLLDHRLPSPLASPHKGGITELLGELTNQFLIGQSEPLPLSAGHSWYGC